MSSTGRDQRYHTHWEV